MKIVLNMAVDYSVEIDEDALKAELGRKPTTADIHAAALNATMYRGNYATVPKVTHISVNEVERYDESKPKARKGVGSY